MLLAVGFAISIVAKFPFPLFKYASSSEQLLNVNSDLGPQSSKFLWTNRTLDLLTQALVIFTAAIGCLALLRTNQTENVKND